MKGVNKMEQMEKKNAERYLVVGKDGRAWTIWAEDFEDALKEVKESAEKDGTGFKDDDIVLILKLDYEEGM